MAAEGAADFSVTESNPPSALSRPWSVVVAKPKALIARARTMACDPLPDLRLLWSILASRLLHALTAVPGTQREWHSGVSRGSFVGSKRRVLEPT